MVDRGRSEIALSIHHMSVGKEGLGMRRGDTLQTSVRQHWLVVDD